MPTFPSPVILVPGIKGSTLRDEYPTTPETVWSLAQAVMSAYDRITLHPYNAHYEAREPRHNLTMQPENPVPVFPFAYDWRQPLAAVQLQLEAFIEEVIARTSLLPHYNKDGFNTTTGKVSLIGHSMGGLIIAGHLAGEGWN